MSKQQIQTQRTPCPECAGKRIWAFTGHSMHVNNPHVKKFTWFGSGSSLDALVCTTCGHTTLYARDPSRLKEE